MHTGPDRRRVDRSPPAPLRVLGRARIRLEHARHSPAFSPGEWYPVVDRTPTELLAIGVTAALPGNLWLSLNGKGRHVKAAHFEVELTDEALAPC